MDFVVAMEFDEALSRSWYKPASSFSTPIIVHVERSWMKQYLNRKIRQQWWEKISLPAEIKLYLNEGIHNTLVNERVSDSFIVSMWVTRRAPPLGSLTFAFITSVMVVKWLMEHTMWLVAVVLMIHLFSTSDIARQNLLPEKPEVSGMGGTCGVEDCTLSSGLTAILAWLWFGTWVWSCNFNMLRTRWHYSSVMVILKSALDMFGEVVAWLALNAVSFPLPFANRVQGNNHGACNTFLVDGQAYHNNCASVCPFWNLDYYT